MCDKYNGWTNRETWLVNVWCNPESKSDVQFARDMLEEQYDSLPAGPLKDMINLGAINWNELFDAFDDEEEEEDAE